MAKPIYRHYGKIVNGIKKYYDIELQQQSVNDLEGKDFEEVIKEKHIKVSTDQFGYYHAGIIDEMLKFEKYRGWTHDDVDDYLSELYLTVKKTLDLNDGNYYIVSKTESKGSGFSRSAMREFIEMCIIHCAKEGIVIKSSEQYYLEKYKL